jgi:hypothetical protein
VSGEYPNQNSVEIFASYRRVHVTINFEKKHRIKTAHARVRGREGVATVVKVKQEKPSDDDLLNHFPGHVGRHHE